MSGKVDSIFNSSGIGLVSVEFFSWDVPTSAWISNGRYLHTVDASNRTITEINQSYAPPTNAYSNSQKNVFTYDATGNMLDRTGCNWDASAKAWSTDLFKQVNTYNSYNQITSASGNVYTNGVWTFDGYSTNEKWYYQTYTVTSGGGGSGGGGGGGGTAVSGPDAPLRLSLSPVPAGDVLHISLKLASPEDIDARIVDLHGRVCQRFVITEAVDVDRHISVAEMPAGNYMLSISGAQGSRFARMFTVSH